MTKYTIIFHITSTKFTLSCPPAAVGEFNLNQDLIKGIKCGLVVTILSVWKWEHKLIHVLIQWTAEQKQTFLMCASLPDTA